ncbi:CIA30 family protein [Psychrobium sp. nBUS_13]|uniref:CIA30 family protein n=1 Tax=Psychrobium sp. nBUS_13 TaxID=3395319 RepID=UPI003EBC469A
MKNIFVSLFVIGLLILFFMLLPTPDEPQQDDQQVTIISGATVFDGNTWLGKTDVAFQRGLIIALGPQLTNQHKTANVIDASGQYLIPGLIDAHTHAWDNALKEAVKYGVTTELDMFTNNAFASTQRPLREQHNVDVQQADLFSAGTLITAPKGHGTEYGFEIDTIENATQANDFVMARIDEGSDYIKIVYNATSRYMPSIDKETLHALVKAAHQQGKLAVVHISDLQSARDAFDAGADGLVHAYVGKGQTEQLASLAKLMTNNKQFMIPTLSIIASMMGQNNSSQLMADFSNEPRFKIDDVSSQLLNLRTDSNRQSLFEMTQQQVSLLHDAGVMILAGTDAPNPGTAHGISMHLELQLLVESGLTPTQALMAATSNVAKAFKLTNRGLIATDYKADFVLLNRDPKVDITNTRAISTVFKNGFQINYNAQEQQNSVMTAMMFSDFDKGLMSALNTTWYPTTDEQFGGNSTVDIVRKAGEQGNYLYIRGELKRKFSFPWAGAFISFSENNKQPMDLTHLRGVALDVKGTAGKYKLMLMSTKQQMRPVEIPFDVTQQWQRKTVSFSTIKPQLLKSVTGMVIVASLPTEKFELIIDNVEFVE